MLNSLSKYQLINYVNYYRIIEYDATCNAISWLYNSYRSAASYFELIYVRVRLAVGLASCGLLQFFEKLAALRKLDFLSDLFVP